MDRAHWFIIVGTAFLIIIPLVPKMIALRVRVLRYFHLYRLADWHERNARGITVGVRILFALAAAFLLVDGIRQL
jgi:hypothetical protein